MLNIPPHLEACRPRGLFSIFHGTSSPVARRCPRASDLVLSAEHAFLLYERPGLHLQSGASAVGGVLRGARRFGKRSPARCSNFNPRTRWGRDAATLTSLRIHVPFQSTPPVRGATTGARKAGKARPVSIHAPRAGCDGKFDGFTRPNLRKRYKKISVQPKKRAKKEIKEMLCSHSHIFGWISGAKVPEFPAR